MTARASLFSDLQTSSLPMRAKYKHFRTICEQTFDISPTDPISSSLNWWCCDFVQLWSCSVGQFAISLHAFLPHDLPCHGTKRKCSRHVSLNKVIFCSSSRDSGFEHAPVTVHNVFACLKFSLSATQINVVKE